MGKNYVLTDRKTQTGAADTLSGGGGSAGDGALRLVFGLWNGNLRQGRETVQNVRKVGTR